MDLYARRTWSRSGTGRPATSAAISPTQYRRYVDAIAPTNKQAQVTNNTEVVGAAVESLDGPDATALVYTNTTSTSPLSKNIPAMRYLSYRLTLRQEDAKWLVTKMSTVTSLDLTPQL